MTLNARDNECTWCPQIQKLEASSSRCATMFCLRHWFPIIWKGPAQLRSQPRLRFDLIFTCSHTTNSSFILRHFCHFSTHRSSKLETSPSSSYGGAELRASGLVRTSSEKRGHDKTTPPPPAGRERLPSGGARSGVETAEAQRKLSLKVRALRPLQRAATAKRAHLFLFIL